MRFEDHLSDFDTYSKSKAAVFCVINCQNPNAVLEIRSCANRFYRTWKLRQETVARVLNNATSMLRDSRINDIPQKRGRRACVASSSSCISRE